MTCARLLLRHAEAARPPGCCVGQWEHPLTRRGHTQITRLAQRWQGPPPRLIVSSDIGRAATTAAVLARRLGTPPPAIDPRLREISMGRWEGESWQVIYAEEADAVDRWGRQWVDCGPPGGESGQEVATRMLAAFNDVGPGTLLVGHQGALALLTCARAGRPLQEAFSLHFGHAAPACVV